MSTTSTASRSNRKRDDLYVLRPGRENRRFHRERRAAEERVLRGASTELILRRVRKLMDRYG
jgi:hypothetical protein